MRAKEAQAPPPRQVEINAAQGGAQLPQVRLIGLPLLLIQGRHPALRIRLIQARDPLHDCPPCAMNTW
jgi:hypothetical protein